MCCYPWLLYLISLGTVCKSCYYLLVFWGENGSAIGDSYKKSAANRWLVCMCFISFYIDTNILNHENETANLVFLKNLIIWPEVRK